jgi:hypothetical protein
VAPSIATMPPARRLAAALGLVGGYALAVRPRLLRWGATDEDVRRAFPGADLIPGATRSVTMAVTIDAPPSRVWPWLVQMGVDRAGWYSWDRLDDFKRRSAERIHPEWQAIAVGDRMAAKPDGSEWWDVAALEPERLLVLRMSLDLRGRPVRPDGSAATLLHRLDLGLPARGAAGAPHAARGQRRLVAAAALASAGHDRRLPGAVALDHAEPPVREPQAAGRARWRAGVRRRGAPPRADRAADDR